MVRSFIVPLFFPAVFARFLVQNTPPGKGSAHFIAQQGAKDGGAIVTIAEAKKEATDACMYTCDRWSGDGGVSASCVTGCETEAHRCLDSNTPTMEVRQRIATCKESVLPKYKQTSPNCCNLIAQRGAKDGSKLGGQNATQSSTHGATVTMTEAKEEATDACMYVCDRWAHDGGVSSTCVTGCETEAHRCLDQNQPAMDIRVRIATCKETVLPKYRPQGSNPNCCNL